jgi:hypothetical protein
MAATMPQGGYPGGYGPTCYELTDGPGWDAPTLQARAIKTTVDIAKVAALAADWLHDVQRSPSDTHRPDGWRIVDGIGRRIKTSEA